VTSGRRRSKDFYCRVLGSKSWIARRSRARLLIGTAGIFPQIHIIQSDHGAARTGAAISPLARHTCFEVADYDAMKATLERRGHRVRRERPARRAGPDAVQRPDGNTLEFQPATSDCGVSFLQSRSRAAREGFGKPVLRKEDARSS